MKNIRIIVSPVTCSWQTNLYLPVNCALLVKQLHC